MAHEESAELAEPGVGSFDDPAAFVASELSAVFVAPVFAVLAIRDDEVDTALCEPLAQRSGVVGSDGDYAFGLLPRTAFGARDFDFGERGFRKRNFSRRGTFEPNSQRKTATVDQYHPLRSLAALGFTDWGAPFSPERSCRPKTPLPTAAGLPHRARPAALAGRPATRPALPTASTAASRSRATDTCRVGTATPVCNTLKMSSRQARLDAHGRPRLSLRRFGAGSSGAINSHCASLNNSNRFLLMQEVHQASRLTQKSLA
jgi:hypothetical protein